jgi:competence protein ComEA
MGIYDRDYMKQDPEDKRAIRLSGLHRVWVWLKRILIGAGVLFVLCLFLPEEDAPESKANRIRQSQPVSVKFPLDANTATLEELLQIPFLHSDVAEAIIEARPYNSFTDVDRAYGVGPKTLERLKPYLYVSNTNTGASSRSR